MSIVSLMAKGGMDVARRFRSRPPRKARAGFVHVRFPRWLFPLAVMAAVIGLGLYLFDARLRPVVTMASTAVAHRAGVEALNQAVTNEIAGDNEIKDLLDTTEESADGDMTVTRVDMAALTRLQGDVTQAAQERLEALSQETIQLPLVQIFSGSLFSSSKWTIPVHVSMLGTVHANIESDVESKGVNQVVHIIYLHVTAEMMIMTPIVSAPVTIETKAPVAYLVMTGPEPSAAYGSDLLDGTRRR